MSRGPTRMDHAFHKELFLFYFSKTGGSRTETLEETAARLALRNTVIHSLTGVHQLAVDLMALHNPEASDSLIQNVKEDYGEFLAEMALPVENHQFILAAAVHVDRLYGF